MDEADISDERMEAEMSARLKHMRENQAKEAEATGSCLNCFEPLPIPKRWCDSDCQHDWIRRKANQ